MPRPTPAATSNADGEVKLQQALVDQLKQAGCIRSANVEAAFRSVPRHLFLPGVSPEQVYRDQAIPTKELDGYTVSSSSQPAIMAFMLEQLQLQPGHRVLEIGAGTGYNAALMAHLVGDTGQVITIDLDDDLVVSAREHLAVAGFGPVRVVCADGGLGFPESAPYDRILLSVEAMEILPAWGEQIRPGGRLVLPFSIRGPQVSVAFEPTADHLTSVSVGDCGFMMLRGAFAEPDMVMQLGAQPGLRLLTATQALANAEAIYEWLTGPSRDWPTTAWVSPGEAFGRLRLWLALHERRFCDLIGQGEWADCGIVPHLFGWTTGGWKLSCTSGLLGESGVCLLMQARAEPDPPEDSQSSRPFALKARSFGPDAGLAHRLVEEVTAWDAAGRPSTDRLRIRAYPSGRDCAIVEGEIAIQKRWSRLILDWQ